MHHRALPGKRRLCIALLAALALPAMAQQADDKAATEAERAAEKVAEQQREKEREQARLRLEEENRKNPGGRIRPEFGSAEDFQLQQALAQLKGLPVQVSKTLTARKEEKKAN